MIPVVIRRVSAFTTSRRGTSFTSSVPFGQFHRKGNKLQRLKLATGEAVGSNNVDPQKNKKDKKIGFDFDLNSMMKNAPADLRDVGTAEIRLSDYGVDLLKVDFKALLGGKSPDSFTYDASFERGGHIVRQAFPYMQRDAAAERVCEFMRKRQTQRTTGRSLNADKTDNPLITIPGSPGSGKSIFLVNFPDSDAYKEYIEKRHGHGSRAAAIGPVVSTFGFNSGMSGNGFVPGLRALFGAAKAMGLLSGKSEEKTWMQFYVDFKKYRSLTLDQAAEILRFVFGNDRRTLMMIDEIAKAGLDAPKMMAQIGAVLESHGDVDVVVSTLSPQYVNDLFRPSQRPIDYVMLPPLLEAGLGKEECERWADMIIKEAQEQMRYHVKHENSGKRVLVGVQVTVDLAIQKFLRSFWMLYSGNPRSIEMMKDAFEKGRVGGYVVKALRDTSVTLGSLLYILVREMKVGIYAHNIASGMDKEQIENIVFRAGRVFEAIDQPQDNWKLRQLLENGTVFIQEADTTSTGSVEYTVAVPGISLIQWMSEPEYLSVSTEYPRTNAAILLLCSLTGEFSDITFATWWERFIAFTIASRSLEKSPLIDIFGLSREMYNLPTGITPEDRDTYSFSARVAAKGVGYKGLPSITSSRRGKKNIMTVYNDSQAGFDAHALVAERGHFYLQAKIQSPQNKKKKSSNQIVASAVPLTILNHLWRYQEGKSDGDDIDIDDAELGEYSKEELLELLKKLKSGAYSQNKGKQLEFVDVVANPPPRVDADIAAADLSDLFYVLYNWGDDGTSSLSKQEVIKLWEEEKAMAKQIEAENEQRSDEDKKTGKGLKKSRLEEYAAGVNGQPEIPGNFFSTVDDYLDKYFHKIRIVNRTVLKNWLPPTFLPFPLMFTALGEEIYQKKNSGQEAQE